MSQQRRLTYVLLLNLVMIAGLVFVGLSSHSLGVLAAGGDFIADSLAIALGLVAVYLRDKRGNRQATTYVALINCLLLLAVTVFVLIQGVGRLVNHTPEIHGLPVFIISVISMLVMIVGVFVLKSGAQKHDLHIRSVLLDTISDGLSAGAVAITAMIIFLSHRFFWLDSIAAIIISIVVCYGAIKLLRDVLKALRNHGEIGMHEKVSM